MTESPNSLPETNERAAGPKGFSLGKVLAVLVLVHLVIALAMPLLFVADFRGLPRNFVGACESVWSIWRCQPVLIALCLFLAKGSPSRYRTLLFIDIAILVFQVASVFFLYACVESHLLR
jgi:hypothetical protein